MGVPAFDNWAASHVRKSLPITALNNSVIGIDAAFYLERTVKEPLLSALGGFPLGLEPNLVRELNDLQSAGLRLHFVFNGLDDRSNDDTFGSSLASAKANATAFETYYDRNIADQGPNTSSIIRVLQKTTSQTWNTVYRSTLQCLGPGELPVAIILSFADWGQLAYFEKHPSQFVDAIYGPSDLFCYGVDKLITRFKLEYQPVEDSRKESVKKSSHFVLEHSEFEWIDRRSCLEELGRIPLDLFIDSLLLVGSRYLDPFPAFRTFEKGYTIRDATTIIANYGRSVTTVCNQYPDDKQIPRSVYLDYLDRYKQALTGIRHHIIVTVEGDIEALAKESAPHDLHDCVGQRLPEELNMYLWRGMVQPRVLNWLASGTVSMLAPYDGGDSRVYQSLIQVQLEPLRKQALSLLADSAHRYWQRKEITTKYWFDLTHMTKFNIKDLLPSPKGSLDSWNVKGNVLSDQLQKLNREFPGLSLGSLGFAIQSLQDADFATSTITPPGKEGGKLLHTREEICANTVWRFLQLRDYVDRHHQLTVWGKVLNSILSVLGHNPESEKAALLAVELLRFDLLKADTMFPSYSGAPFRGSGRAPFFDEDSCALGVVVLTYLDELFTRSDPTSEATREETKLRGQGWVKHCDFNLNLDHAFHLWDAVSPTFCQT
ncbi:MAG: hypothetical protein Q9219_003640 [cf. Caloplaca sp. 3 TL-2023]